MRKEMAFIRKSLGVKQISDEDMLERNGFHLQRTEVASTSYSRIYRSKRGENEEMVCKVILLDKMPKDLKQNLLDISLKIQRYVGGADDSSGQSSSNEPTNTSPNQTKHVSLVRVIDMFATNQKVYIFLEECQAISLKKKMKASETVDENEVKAIIKSVAECVQYLHSIGVSHTNLKPKNVIYDKQNQLKIVGLNYCSLYWDSDMETVVFKKKLPKKEFEKKSHLSPEVFKAETYDPSLADVWSVGVLMCQLIGKENPFKIKSDQTFTDQWKAFAESKTFTDEAKQLLDRIFTEDTQTRPNITQLLDDPYLKPVVA
jgi:serine/threonine protein kinase